MLVFDNEPAWLRVLAWDWLECSDPPAKKGDRHTFKQCLDRARETGGVPARPVRGNALRRLYSVCAASYTSPDRYEMLVRFADKHIEVPVGQYMTAHDVTTLAVLEMHRNQARDLANAMADMAYALQSYGYDVNAWVYVFLDLLDVQDCDGIVPHRT
jgi:hypothetical protein